MKHTLGFLLIVLAIGCYGGKKFRCDYKYFADAKSWLKLHKIPANWRDARLRCRLEGGNLASPLNVGLKSAMQTLMGVNTTIGSTYTGIHATFSKGDFFSIEGVPLLNITHTWADGEPDNYNDEESCIAMLPSGKIADVNCSRSFPYICYKDSSTVKPLTGCGTTDGEYKLDSRTGSCYKFHRVARTWSRAYMTCAAEGGHLAIINSDTEALVIEELFAKNPIEVMVGYFGKNMAYIGFHDWTENGDWITIHGQTLQEAGYDKFAVNELNGESAGCGAVFRSGKLDDRWCGYRHPFICEKSPDSLVCGEDK